MKPLRRLFGWSRARREVDDEIRAHIDLRIDDLIDAGLDPDDARREAQRRFGPADAARRALYASARARDRRLRRRGALESVGRDLALGLRRMREEPGLASVAIATFALGIGLTTATFSVVDNTLLRPLTFDEADALVSLHSVDSEGNSFPWVSAANWIDWNERNRTLASSAIYSIFGSVTVSTDDDAFVAAAKYVSGRFFETLRMPVLAGRTFGEGEVRDREAVAVVSESFWRRALGAADLPVETTLSGRRTRVIGVLKGGYEHPAGTELWLPARYTRQAGGARNNINWYAVGRLRHGASLDAARTDLSAIAADIRAVDPAGIYSWGVGVFTLQEEIIGDSERTLLLALGSVLAVLLIACANLAGLELARSSARTHETALRLALGAGRIKVIQERVAEQTALALVGGALGAALAWWGTRVLVGGGTLPVPRAAEVNVDIRVLGFAILASVTAGVLAGVAPALIASRTAPRQAMAGGARTVRGGRNAPGALLVGAEIALAAVLLISGGLLVRSFTSLTSRDLGFDAENVVTAEVALSAARYREDSELRVAYWDAAVGELAAIPGATAAAAANPIPTATAGRGFVAIEDRPDLDAGADFRVVDEGFFDLLGIPLLAGRAFDAGDTADSEAVVVINRAMAEAYWPAENPVGRRLRATSQEAARGTPPRTVVGIVENIRHWGFDDDEIDTAMYVPHRQAPDHVGATAFMIRGAAGIDLAALVRERLRGLDPQLAVTVSTLERRLGNRLAEERLVASTMSLFAALAMGLAAVGVYGLLSFAVGQRTPELAVRVAVGAQRGDIIRLVLSGALKVAAGGLLIGLAVAYALAGVLQSLLVDIGARDPGTFAVVSITVVATAVAAAAVPALRAARLSPLTALRRG